MENLNKFIKWHKAIIDKIMKSLNIDWYSIAWISWFKGLIVGLIIMALLSSCTVAYTPYDHYSYDDHPHTTEVYYWNDLVYFGYYAGFYYYYGVPHYYPWWY